MFAVPAGAEGLRVATWAGDFSRKGPGLLFKQLSADDPVAGEATLLAARPDVLLLTDFDFDAGGMALLALRDRLQGAGLRFDYHFAVRPNTGMATGLDLDGDGRRGGPRDAQGYGWFSGQGGQAVLSRWPVTLLADYSALLWRDVPGQIMPPDDPGKAVQRLSSSAHWALSIDHPDGAFVLLTVSATPPVFDGPEDRNGRRNRDEVLFWPAVLDGAIGEAPDLPVVLLGNMNLDPARGDGRRQAMRQVLRHSRLQDPLPGKATVSWDVTGPMRVSYVLPDAALIVRDAGIASAEPEAGPHRLVWVDLALP